MVCGVIYIIGSSHKWDLVINKETTYQHQYAVNQRRILVLITSGHDTCDKP